MSQKVYTLQHASTSRSVSGVRPCYSHQGGTYTVHVCTWFQLQGELPRVLFYVLVSPPLFAELFEKHLENTTPPCSLNLWDSSDACNLSGSDYLQKCVFTVWHSIHTYRHRSHSTRLCGAHSCSPQLCGKFAQLHILTILIWLTLGLGYFKYVAITARPLLYGRNGQQCCSWGEYIEATSNTIPSTNFYVEWNVALFPGRVGGEKVESILARQETCPGLQYTALFTLHANKVVLVKLSSISHYSQAPLVVVKITNAQFKKPGQASQVVGITTGRQRPDHKGTWEV